MFDEKFSVIYIYIYIYIYIFIYIYIVSTCIPLISCVFMSCCCVNVIFQSEHPSAVLFVYFSSFFMSPSLVTGFLTPHCYELWVIPLGKVCF